MTPAISLFVECGDQDELERLFVALAEDGEVFMPLDDYGFSRRYGWVRDRYGVPWQLNLRYAERHGLFNQVVDKGGPMP
jgi:predicted 3-demethylubiquinone-9 3-methyltransferase (glyoxalase superfamily)